MLGGKYGSLYSEKEVISDAVYESDQTFNIIFGTWQFPILRSVYTVYTVVHIYVHHGLLGHGYYDTLQTKNLVCYIY